MARLLPAQAGPDAPQSEKRVFDLLRAIPDRPSWTVLHSLGLSSGLTGHHGEIDFLVVIPGRGLLCLEVKGGGVSCTDGRWSSTDRSGRRHELRRSPIEQAKQGIWKLRTALENRFGRNSPEAASPIGWLLVLSDIPCLPPSPEFTRQEVLDMHDLRGHITGRIEAAPSLSVDAGVRGRTPPNTAVADRIVQFLRPNFERVPTFGGEMWHSERLLVDLTEEQYAALDATGDNRTCAILGPAGTGKTMIAVEAARREAGAGRRSILACYNRNLGRWLATAALSAAPGGAILGTSLHSHLRERILTSSISDEFQHQEKRPTPDFFGQDYFDFAALAIEELGDRFDTVILDEVQDFDARAIRKVVDAWTSGNAEAKVLLLGDFARQSIYGSSMSARSALGESFQGLATFRLSLNCRNTQMIAKQLELATGSAGLRVSNKAPEGDPVEYLPHSSKDEMCRNLSSALNGLRDQGVKAEEVVVLFQRRPSDEFLSVVASSSRSPLREFESPVSGYVLWTTIHAFKGLERPVVILADVVASDRDEVDSLLYVGMSRARLKLIVLCDDKTRALLDQRIIEGITGAKLG